MQAPSAPVLPKRDFRRLAIVDPKSKPAAAELARASSGASSTAGKPGKHAIAIVDPSSKQQLSALDWQASGSQLDRSDSTSSSTVSTGKKLIAIVDPDNKQPVQLPVQPLGISRLARSSSNISAASSDSHQPAKRTIAIVDPHNKQPVVLPQSQHQRALPDNARRRAKMPLAIMDPVTSAQVWLPDAQGTSTASSRHSQQLHSRPVRARKPLAIVDPKAKGQSAQSSRYLMQTADEAVDAVSVRLHVSAESSVHCFMEVEPAQFSTQHTGHAADDTHQIRLSLLAQADGNVACSIAANAGEPSFTPLLV